MPYLLTPAAAPGICPRCFNPLNEGFSRCFACGATEPRLDAVVPISYCLAGGQLHHDLLDYKHAADRAVPFVSRRLALVLDGFLAAHERCVAGVAGVAGVARFDLVTTVPSNDRRRDRFHPLRTIVGQLTPRTRDRHRRVLLRSSLALPPRTFNPRRFEATVALSGLNVLLIDDIWTTGASAESAAAALKRAGARTVAAVVIGRYVNGGWRSCGDWLTAVAEPFSERRCVVCSTAGAEAA